MTSIRSTVASLAVATFLAGNAVAGDLVYQDGFEGEDSSGGGEVECADSGLNLSRTQAVTYRRALNQGRRFGLTYDEVFEDWGTSASAFIEMEGHHYASLPFTIPASAPDGLDARLRWSDITHAPGAVRVSVSRCIGPPTLESAVAASCYAQASGVAGGFSMKLAGLSGCQLQRGVPYYFNFAFVGVDGLPTCFGIGPCNWATDEQ